MGARKALQPVAAGHQGLFPPRQRRVNRKAGLIAAAAAGLLSACTGELPLPESALLAQQPAPRCEYRGTKGDGAERKADAPAEQAAQLKLDYERQCYRHAEMIARAKLRKLQKSVTRTMLALKTERAKTTELPRSAAGP